MKPTITFGAVAFAVLTFAQQKNPVQQMIEKQIASYTKAMESKDVNGVMVIVSPTFSATGPKGQSYNREHMLIQLKSLFASAKKIHVATTVKSFKLDKGSASLTSQDVLDVDLPGNDGKVMKYHSESVSNEVWVPMNAVWKLKASKTVSEKRTLDGKPIS